MEEQTFNIKPTATSHTFTVKDRNVIELSGVKTIQSFDSQEFLISTPYGCLHIKGKNLTISKMDTDHELLSIKGQIDQISYIGDKKVATQTPKENIFSKIFK